MTIDNLIDFAQSSAQQQACRPRPERLLSGNPAQSVQNHYASACGQFNSGIWTSEVGTWRVSYSEHEYCEMLSGRCAIHDDNGATKIVQAGDRFVIPAGFSGIWEVLEPCSKVYVSFEASA